MTKDEQLKIYSAYLPYKLNVKSERTGIIYELNTFSDMRGRGIENRDIETILSDNFKPVLYDLSYLTKEIEYNCLIIKPIEYISTSIADRNKILKMVENKEPLDVLPQWKFEKLLKFHFNVFNLSEDQFINKITLKQ